MNELVAPGTLWLIPTPLGEEADPLSCLPDATREIACRLDYFIAENARSARAFLKGLPIGRPLQQIEVRELSEHTPEADFDRLLAPITAGRDAGLVSEAGCPAIADPGAGLIAMAHTLGVTVRPLIGPSSIVLALMASGLVGQRFSFAGYLPQQAEDRVRAARELEARSARNDETIIMIETPYRNQAFADALIASLAPGTSLCIASAISLPSESIATRAIQAWRKAPPQLSKIPTVFLIQAQVARPIAGPRGRNFGTGYTTPRLSEAAHRPRRS